MKSHVFRLFACAAALCAASLSVSAKVDAPVMLRGAVDEVLSIAYDSKASASPLAERVKPTLEKYFSFETITRRAIGPGWRQFSPEQQARAVTLFTDLVIRTYANKFEAGQRPGITYAPAVTPDPAKPGQQELPTTIDYAGKKYSVSYRVEQSGESWRVYDVNIEGVSMIANWRSQLAPVFQRGGAPAVIEALEKNLAQTNAK